MGTLSYGRKHNKLGLCRNCPRPLAEGSLVLCVYHRDKSRERGRRYSKALLIRLKNECLEQYGKECVCCKEKIVQFLTIDHKEGKGNIHRKNLFKYNISGRQMYKWLKKNNFPKDFQILCMNCNWATRYGTICPHKLER